MILQALKAAVVHCVVRTRLRLDSTLRQGRHFSSSILLEVNPLIFWKVDPDLEGPSTARLILSSRGLVPSAAIAPVVLDSPSL
mmetsp:Transcript_23253/g.38545  ORF Transcript_23253/g.38545 Transcript_23253/m.38545 type:complete len:83 (+) Transcript_23253:441-689(+)